MLKRDLHIALFLCCISCIAFAQNFDLPKDQKYEKVKFQLVNNVMVIPIEVNGTALSFILDSGVSTPLLFNLTEQDSIQINKVSEITIRGLGEGEPIQALSSRSNSFKIGAAQNQNQELYVVLDQALNLSPSLGIPIHGIIGYDLFRDFVVEINYNSKHIKFHNPELYHDKQHKKSQTLSLAIRNKKAYVKGAIVLNDSEEIPVRMLLDTGSSDAIWLFENETIGVPTKNYDDFLGRGLAGNIYGKRTKINSIKIGDFVIKDAKTAFPDRASFGAIKSLGNRNGSLGGEVLKRFNFVFDYANNKITLRKNGNFKEPFHYNLSGIDLQHNGVRYISESIAGANGIVRNKDSETFGNVQILMENQTRLSLVPEIIVSGIRAGSPAADAGLLEGDVILAVNGKSVHTYKLQQILQMLNERKGKRIKVLIERQNDDKVITFVLKDVFKKP
ncbi:aspartyl protease family protein [Maribacter sp. 2308TA10-17]|uniref:aspartyl protease family protein n=1 Tax=Maribacter sp. 2308TA10-17 TaxID=3386276 RepID=UPI0039BC44DF